METESTSNYWWLKSSKISDEQRDFDENKPNLTSTPKQTDDPSTISSSLKEFLEKERALRSPDDVDTDIGSIIEEINKLAAQSPLGPYEKDTGERSFEEIMKEAEKLYMESSKSFEQLSARSRTSGNLSLSFNNSPNRTPTPKSASPLPLDVQEPIDENRQDVDDTYSDDFDIKSGPATPTDNKNPDDEHLFRLNLNDIGASETDYKLDSDGVCLKGTELNAIDEIIKLELAKLDEESSGKVLESKMAIHKLEEENKQLLDSIGTLKTQLEETNQSLANARVTLNVELQKSPELNLQLEKALEELKDTKETNTVLQLQLDTLNKTHLLLKTTYEELLTSNNNLERRVVDTEATLFRYKLDLQNLQEQRDKLAEGDNNLAKLLEIEKLQAKSLKLQNEKDARCILDLNRQVKEMERIIARKHPDSVSALIVAAKNDQTENNLTARKLLEDRVRSLETEVSMRDQQSSKVFLEVQEKFTEMKTKYESHIEDLELHVSDLKDQIKRRTNTFDVYTQTFFDDQKIPGKETKNAGTQTAKVQMQKVPSVKKPDKEDAHLLATIRGLQADLVNKEKVITKLQRELDELKKTNKRLQKEREGSLKNVSERREFHSYPEQLTNQVRPVDDDGEASAELREELRATKAERDTIRSQLRRMEEDYQNLKTKRLFDLSALQQAHEEELATYMSNLTSLRKQSEGQRATINNLHEQLSHTKEQMDVMCREREELTRRILKCGSATAHELSANGNLRDPSNKKINAVEKLYEEHEYRLKAIMHSLAQKTVTSQGCQQCSARQQELILYKAELDQLLAAVRTLA